jgi:hypothetical protein
MISIQRTTVFCFLVVNWRTAFGFSMAHAGHGFGLGFLFDISWRQDHYWYD